MSTKKPNDFELFVHYKQGDDLAHFLEKAENKPVQALRDWADNLASGVDAIREVAAILEGTACEVHADTHHISIHNVDDTVAAKLENTPCVNRMEWDDGEDDEDDLADEVSDIDDDDEFDDDSTA